MAVLTLITKSHLVGCLHRQVGEFLALEDAIGVAGRAALTRRAPRNCWYRAKSAQISAVANRARGDLAAIGGDSVYDQSLAPS